MAHVPGESPSISYACVDVFVPVSLARMNYRPIAAAAVMAISVVPFACGGSSEDGATGDADAAPDAFARADSTTSLPDATRDTALPSEDAPREAAADVVQDVAHDSTVDAKVDATSDAGLDATQDAAPDAAKDAQDASQDATPDAAQDAAPDAPSDANQDSSSDSSVGDGGLAATSVFGVDPNVLALFELNGSLDDTSGNGRHAGTIVPDAGPDAGAPVFVPTAFGEGLFLPKTLTQGFQWNAYAPLMTKPHTIEMVVVPTATTCYGRLFSFNRTNDQGFYICNGFQAYPNTALGPVFPPGERLYLALIVRSGDDAGPDVVDVYVNGAFRGTSVTNYTAPPMDAVFFRDESAGEQLPGVVEAVRISSGARQPSEISAVQSRLQSRSLDGGTISDSGGGG